MSNDKVSFRVPADLKDELDRESLNASGLMRELLKNYVRVGDTVEASLQRRLKDKEEELNTKQLEKRQIENEIGQIEREIDRIEEKIADRRQNVPEEVVEFATGIRANTYDESMLTPENPALVNKAQKAGLPPERFIAEVRERL